MKKRIRRTSWTRKRRPRKWSSFLFYEKSPCAGHTSARREPPVLPPSPEAAMAEYLNVLRETRIHD